jgi:hypothetical protein
MQGKARLRGLYRIISSKTIRPRLCKAKPACAGYTGLFLQRPYALGYPRRSPPARAIPDYFFKDHTPSAIQGKARLRGTRTPMVTLSTIGYRLSVIGYRLSAIGDDQPSALEGEACLRGLYWILFLKFIILIAACGA